MFVSGFQPMSEIKKFNLSFGADKLAEPKATLEQKAKGVENLVNKLDETIGDKIQNKKVKQAFSMFHSIIIPVVTFAVAAGAVKSGGEQYLKQPVINFIKYLAKPLKNNATFLQGFRKKIIKLAEKLVEPVKNTTEELGANAISKIERYCLNPLMNIVTVVFAGLLGLNVAFNKDQRDRVEGFVEGLAGNNDNDKEDSSHDK